MDEPAQFRLEPQGGGVVAELGGDWTATNLGAAGAELAAEL